MWNKQDNKRYFIFRYKFIHIIVSYSHRTFGTWWPIMIECCHTKQWCSLHIIHNRRIFFWSLSRKTGSHASDHVNKTNIFINEFVDFYRRISTEDMNQSCISFLKTLLLSLNLLCWVSCLSCFRYSKKSLQKKI